MFAVISRSEGPGPGSPVPLQRAEGSVRLTFRGLEGVTRLSRHYEQGAAKARLPRVPGGAAEAVLINTAGGLTGGDRMDYAVDIGAGAAATLTTQAGEKIYRALDAPAEIRTRIDVGAGGRADWLPQETILFDRAALMRRLDIAMAADATVLALEAVVFGRTARGETVQAGMLRDRWRLCRAGRLVFADGLRLDGAIAATLARPAALNGGCAVATVVYAAPDAEARLEAALAALAGRPAEAGASAWNGILVARLAAIDGARLRATLLPLLATLREGRALPRVWLC